MRNFSICVAITTFNRCGLVGRAIQSVLNQTVPASEVIVVDDASTDNTAEYVRDNFPQLRYLVQTSNQGCGAARNRALRDACTDYVLILDDDDTLLPAGLEIISSRMNRFEDLAKYPVLNFAHGDGRLPEPYRLARLDDYLHANLRADFVPVIRRKLFVERDLSYPHSKIGGEHMLWWKIAEDCGIPTWADRVGIVHADAAMRLTSVRSQLSRAREHAELQERTLVEFGAILRARFPEFYRKKLLGAAAYRLLAGDRTLSRSHLRTVSRLQFSKGATALLILTHCPALVARQLFLAYRLWCGGER